MRDAQDRFDGRLRYLFEPTSGKPYALNTGIAATHGDLIGLIDDDEEVDEGWFECIAREFEVDSVDFIGGKVLPRWEAARPQWLFDLCGMPRLNHPAVFACLAMVVGVYSLLYFEVARRPEHGFAIAAVGLLGKILGPVGLFVLVVSGTWPVSSIVLGLTNDVVWYVPFGLYLRDAWPHYRASLAPRPPGDRR